MSTAVRVPAGALPILEPGDHLTLEDFDRIYEQRPDIKKAELIFGVVYMPSPVRVPEHAEPVGIVTTWLGNYALRHRGVRFAVDGSTKLSDQAKVQPDVMMWNEGGRSRVDEDTHHLIGPPELVVEITASSASYDLHEKKDLYRAAGVQEYVVWRTLEGEIDWFALKEGEYVRLEPDEAGITHSEVFPGLSLDIPRLLGGDDTAILPQA